MAPGAVDAWLSGRSPELSAGVAVDHRSRADAAGFAHVGRREQRSGDSPGPMGDHRYRGSGELIGGVALLPLPPGCTELEIGWQVAPKLWGHGYGAEAGHAVAHQAFTNIGVNEVFAVVRPGNHRGVATARRVGMDWVGETDKYYNLTLEVYRLSKADLDLPEPACAPAQDRN